MDTKSRIYLFIEKQGISVAEFERRCSLSNGYIKNFKGSFGSAKLEGILNAFPLLNREWLLYGEGEMLKKGGVYQYNQNGDNLNDQSVTIQKADELIEVIKIQSEHLSKSQELVDVLKTQSAQLAKSQEQIDRLLAIIERMQK